jgi:flagellar basal-body rod protein FlgF
MNDASSVALSAQLAVLHETDIIANNLANLSTTGFKGQHVAFAQFLSRTSDGTPIAYVQEQGVSRDPSQGPINTTGNRLDVAIRGTGYFTIQTPLGDRYTRDGHFQLDSTGQIVTSQGYPVLSDGGSPLLVPDRSGEITIAADGGVSTLQGQIGKLGLVTFPNEQAMTETAGGYFMTDQASEPAPEATRLMQGALEGSNVEPIVEISRLIGSQHNVEYSKTFVDVLAQETNSAIDHLGKVP